MDAGDFLGGELLLGIAISLINIAVHTIAGFTTARLAQTSPPR